MNNKSLPRRLQPGMDRSFIVLIVFCALALVFQYYMLAIVEAVLTALFFVYYLVLRARRNKEIRSFIQSTFETLDVTMKAENPFPMVLVRLVDGGIIWGNDKFSTLTGFREKMYEQRLSDVVEGLPTDWLASGRSEYSQDVVVNGRRYRVHGSIARGDDRHSMMMGMMYFTDLTEMYQVRDEYIRSRPVVSIILVDNYEELTMNLSESAISTMNAEINDIITKWAEGYHGLLRKLERNRYLFVFEKRYLEEAQKGKFSVLEDIHQVVNPSGLAASISFGLGISGESFEESYDFAALAIEMALSRGGDQGPAELHLLRWQSQGGGPSEQGPVPCDSQLSHGAFGSEQSGVHHGTPERGSGCCGCRHGHRLYVP